MTIWVSGLSLRIGINNSIQNCSQGTVGNCSSYQHMGGGDHNLNKIISITNASINLLLGLSHMNVKAVLHDKLLGGCRHMPIYPERDPSQSKATITHLLILANQWGFTGIANRSTNERLFTGAGMTPNKSSWTTRRPQAPMWVKVHKLQQSTWSSLSSLQAAHFLCGLAGRPPPLPPPDSCLLLLDIAGKALSRIFWVSVPPDMWPFVYPLKLPSFFFAPWAGGWCFNLECCNPKKNSTARSWCRTASVSVKKSVTWEHKDLSRGENTKGNYERVQYKKI